MGKSILNLKYILKTGDMVIFWEKEPEELCTLSNRELKNRLYKIVQFEADGRIQFRFHQTALAHSSSNKDDLTILTYMKSNSLKNSQINFKEPLPWLRLRRNNWNFAVNQTDFIIDSIGNISFNL